MWGHLEAQGVGGTGVSVPWAAPAAAGSSLLGLRRRRRGRGGVSVGLLLRSEEAKGAAEVR